MITPGSQDFLSEPASHAVLASPLADCRSGRVDVPRHPALDVLVRPAQRRSRRSARGLPRHRGARVPDSRRLAPPSAHPKILLYNSMEAANLGYAELVKEEAGQSRSIHGSLKAIGVAAQGASALADRLLLASGRPGRAITADDSSGRSCG
jgi:hypothetical protein